MRAELAGDLTGLDFAPSCVRHDTRTATWKATGPHGCCVPVVCVLYCDECAAWFRRTFLDGMTWTCRAHGRVIDRDVARLSRL